MTLIKTSFLNGIAVIVKILTLFGINKVLALYVGPSGYASLGQFQNSVQMLTAFASGAIGTGVTKYTAEYYDSEQKQHVVWQTSGTISILLTLFTSFLIICFNKKLSEIFLNDSSFGSVFIWFAITLIFFVFNNLFLAILNGKKEIGRYVLANIMGSIFSLLVSAGMVVLLGLYGALLALAVYQSLSFFVTLCLVLKAKWFRVSYLFGSIDKAVLKNLSKYAAMALTAAFCVPVSHILVRSHLGNSLGWSAAGYWEAMWRFSGAYLMIITTTLSVYYLPRLAELKSASDIRAELWKGYKLIIPFMFIFCGVIYFLRNKIIVVLFSSDFLLMEGLFFWQLIGDVLKVSSWLLSYLLLSKGVIALLLVAEIASSLGFYLIVSFLTNIFGIEGASIAHAINYFLYGLVLLIYIRIIKLI